jgi:glycosyltransferase involved in cell wall biosynthesis
VSDDVRVLRVLHVFGRLERGGAELRTIEIAESFRGQPVRSDFLVLTGLDGALDDRVRRAGGEVIKCRLDARFPAALYRLLRARRYDVVHSHVHYFSGVILAIARLAATRGRVAHFRSAVANDGPTSARRRLQLALCRRLLDLAATDILAVGEGAMRLAWGPNWRADPRCRIVYSGLPPERLRPYRLRLSDAPTLVNVGSLQPLKNQLRLIGIVQRCLRELPSLQLLLIGRDVDRYASEVRRQAEAFGLSDRVRWLGEVEDAMPWIAGADLMIAPSQWEGLPGSVLEACALGVPVLASDLPGTRELAHHFPHVHLLSLHETDEVWAAAAARLVRQGRGSLQEAAEQLAKSPFTLDRSRRAHYEVWSRFRATA